MKTQDLKADVKIVILCDMDLLRTLFFSRTKLIASTRDFTAFVIWYFDLVSVGHEFEFCVEFSCF
jgi:hypothetical protein